MGRGRAMVVILEIGQNREGGSAEGRGRAKTKKAE